MTWAEFADTHADREWEGWAEFYSAIDAAGLDDTERQAAYRDWRINYGAAWADMEPEEFLEAGRATVKGHKTRYRDASTATEETAT
jgi:hypothetical protein